MNIKYKSRKFIAACWSATLLTFLSVYSMITNISPPWMSSLFPFLALLITVWVGGEAIIDSKQIKKPTN